MNDIGSWAGRYFAGDSSVLNDPYPVLHSFRESGPVHRVGGDASLPGGDSWHVFDYANVAALLTDDRLSARRDLGGRPEFDAEGAMVEPPPMMLTMDPPDHTRLRRLVLAAFTPRTIERMRSDIEALVGGLLDQMEATNGSFDLVQDVAYPLPTVVIAKLLGAPEADWALFKQWSAISFTPDPRAAQNAREFADYLTAIVAERRQTPRDDLISAMITARDQGDLLSDAELIGQFQLLLAGGHETTSFAIATAVLNLLRQPGAWASLPGFPIAAAVDELLRYDAPFQLLNRRAKVDLVVANQTIPAGDFVWLWVGSANHDPSRFTDPDLLHLDRADNRHLSFGFGIHYCLGAALARMEIQIALSALRERYPALRLVEDEVVWRDPAIRGPKVLSLAWQ